MFVGELPCEPCVTICCCGNHCLLAVLTSRGTYPAQSQKRKEQCHHPPPPANRRNTNRILKRQPPAVSPRPSKRGKKKKKRNPRYMVLTGGPRPPSTGRRGCPSAPRDPHHPLPPPLPRAAAMACWDPRAARARLACTAGGDASGADAVCGYARKGGQRRTGGCDGWGVCELVSWCLRRVVPCSAAGRATGAAVP